MRNRVPFAMLLFLFLLGSAPAQVDRDDERLTTRLVVSKPVIGEDIDWSVPRTKNLADAAWEPLSCDGTEVLDGVGLVRVQGFATWTGTAPLTSEAFRTLYDDGMSNWYGDTKPVLPPNQEVLVTETVQDLNPNPILEDEPHFFKFKNKTCKVGFTNVPDVNGAFISHRNPNTAMVESLRIEIRRYAPPHEVLPCGFDGTAGRVKVLLFATSPVDAVMDFHMHQERERGTPGPDQDGDGVNKRWWEMGMDNIVMQAGVEKNVLYNSAIPTGVGKTTFHFMQQHAPSQMQHQTFCSITHTPAR